MAQPRMFTSKPEVSTQPPLHETIAKLLKSKFNLQGDVRSFPLTEDRIERVRFFLDDQGCEQKPRDQLVSDFFNAICRPGTVTINNFPTPQAPHYYPYAKNTTVRVDTTELLKLHTALELLSEPTQQSYAEYAKC